MGVTSCCGVALFCISAIFPGERFEGIYRQKKKLIVVTTTNLC